MTTLVKQIKLVEDYSYLSLNHFHQATGELVVEMNGLSVTFGVDAKYEAETYEDYDGYATTELGAIYDIKLSVKAACTLNEWGEEEQMVHYSLNSKDVSALEILVEHVYCNTDPDFAAMKRDYTEMMEGF